jgi:hypothetical protein
VFVFWAWVYGGWRGAAAALGTYAVLGTILVLMTVYVPWLNPGFVLVPVVVIPIVVLWRRETRREHEARRDRPSSN